MAHRAPTIGPTVGGYLTDAFSWHWLFFINVVPGMRVTVAAFVLIDFGKGRAWSLFRNFDWVRDCCRWQRSRCAREYVLERRLQRLSLGE